MAKITNDKIIASDLFVPAIKNAETFIRILDDMEASVIKVAKAQKKILQEQKAFNNTDDINRAATAQKKLSEAQRISEQIQKDRLKAQERLKIANSDRIQQNTQIKVQLTEQNKINKRLARETLGLVGAYEKESKTLIGLRKKYKDLAVQNKANTKEGRALLANITSLDTKLKAVDASVGQNQRNVGNYTKSIRAAIAPLKALGATLIATFSFRAVGGFFKDSINAFREQERSLAQVRQGIESTGGIVGFTVDELAKKAQQLQGTTLFGDEEILKGATAQLLTFTNITEDNFLRTQEAALDLATRLDGDLKSASIQLGKALNDPVANLSALSRSGIQFSKSQKDVIKSLNDSGQLAEAQSLILDELSNQYGGSAAAAADADVGFEQLGNTFGDVQELIGEVITGGLRPLIVRLKEFFETIDADDIRDFFSALKTGAKIILIAAAALAVYKTTAFLAANQVKIFAAAQKIAAFAQSIFNGSLKLGTLFMKGFNKVTKANPIGLLITVLTTAAVAFGLFSDGADEATESQEDLNEAVEEGRKLLSSTEDIERRARTVGKLSKRQLKTLIEDTNAELKIREDKQATIIKQENEFAPGVLRIQEDSRKAIEKINDQLTNSVALSLSQRAELREKRARAQKTLDQITIDREVEGAEGLTKTLIDNQIERLNIAKETAEAQLEIVKNRVNLISKEELKLQKRLIDVNNELIKDEEEKRLAALAIRFKRERDAIESNSKTAAELKSRLTELEEKQAEDIRKQFREKRQAAEERLEKIISDRKKALTQDSFDKQRDQINAEFDKQIEDIKENEELSKAVRVKAIKELGEIRIAELAKIDEDEKAAIITFEEEIGKLRLDQRKGDFQNEKDFEVFKAKELLKIQIKAAEERLKLLEGIEGREAELQRETLKAQIAGFNEEISDINKAARKEELQEFTDFASNISKEIRKLSDERVKSIDKDISAAEKREDELRKLAAEGVQDATDNIANAQARQAELAREREKEIRRQKNLELGLTALETYNAKVQAGDENPLAGTFRDILALRAFIAALPAFHGGTDNVGRSLGAPHLNTANDRYLVRVGGEESILDGANTAKREGLTNDELGNLAMNYKQGNLQNPGNFIPVHTPYQFESNQSIVNGQNRMIAEIKTGFKNMPENRMYYDDLKGMVLEIVKRGNKTDITERKPRRLHDG